MDFDDRPGLVRDALASSVKTWLAAVQRAVVQAKEEGHLSPDADERQVGFEIHGLILAVHYEARFLKAPGSIDRATKAFEQILTRYGAETHASNTSKTVKSPAPKAAVVKMARKYSSKSTTRSNQE